QRIDEEVRDIVIAAYKKTAHIIKNNLATLQKIAEALLEKETLNSSDIDELMAGVKNFIPEEIEAETY
ncbi:MAG: cell division protein FtsH, partial [Deltaproteobacteria bacterium]|nr:cell division protein FtsH [Deltaproteobacteria bacterium]